MCHYRLHKAQIRFSREELTVLTLCNITAACSIEQLHMHVNVNHTLLMHKCSTIATRIIPHLQVAIES